jgi:hypothetical protein
LLGTAGGRVTLAPVGNALVALPLSGSTATRAGFLPAGCDPALPLLEAPLALLDPPVAFAWWPCAGSEALRPAAAAGSRAVAGYRDIGQNGRASTVSDAPLPDDPYPGLDADLRRSPTELVHAREVPAVRVAHELAEGRG